jgi:hypothetical protein
VAELADASGGRKLPHCEGSSPSARAAWLAKVVIALATNRLQSHIFGKVAVITENLFSGNHHL